MPARSNRIAAECRNTCMVTDFCASDGQTPAAICNVFGKPVFESVAAECLSRLCDE